MSACRQSRRWMERAFEGRLAVDEEFLLEEHVETCSRCRAEFEAQALLLDSLARLPEPPADRIDIEQCLAAVNERLGRDASEPVVPTSRHWMGWAAAALLVGAPLTWLALSEQPDSLENELSVAVVQDVPDPSQGAAPRAVSDGSHTPPPQEPPPEEVPSGVPSVVVHPLQESAATDLDMDRYANVQARVRAALEQAALAYLAEGSADVAAFIASFESATDDLTANDWPVARQVTALVRDLDPVIAGAACRYTGRRATRLGISRLEEALDSDASMAAAMGLVDAGLLGLDGLGRALWDTNLTGLVVLAVDELEENERLLWAVESLDQAPAEFGQPLAAAGAWINLVAGTGRAGAAELLGRLGDPRLPRSEVLEGLTATGVGSEVLVERLDQRILPSQTLALLDATQRLLPDEAFHFVREQAWSGQHRDRAARVLASYPGLQPLYGLLKLDEGRRLDGDGLAEAWRVALDLDPDRATLLAVEHRERGDRTGSRRLLENLALSAHPQAVPALIELALLGSLASEDRVRALLLVAELGSSEHVPALLDTFAALGQRDRDHSAACMFAIHRLGGAEAVLRALDGASDRTRERVLAHLKGDARATSLLLLARDLEPVLASHEALTWRESR